MQPNNLIINNSNNHISKWKFWPMMAVFYILFVARNIFSLNFPVYIYLIWVAVMACIFNDTETKALLISFIPLAPGFQGKYGILICMIALIVKNFKYLKMPYLVFIIPILMLWEILHMGLTNFSLAEYFSGFAPLMSLAVVVSLPNKREDITFFIRVLATTCVVAFSILLVSTVMLNGQSLMNLMQEGFRLGSVEVIDVAHKITYNANGLGYICNITIAGILINIYFKSAKLADYLMLIFIVLIGCLTVSRTFLLCLLGTVVMYILIQNKSIHYKIRGFVILAIILVVAFFTLKLIAPNIIENYLFRFGADDVTGGRAKLYEFYNQFINSSAERFWYGIGVQNIDKKILEMVGVKMDVPHNGYQQAIVAWGVIGLILLLLLLLSLVLLAKKRNPNAPLICYLPLALLLVNIMAGQFITSGTKLISLVFIYLMIANGRKGSLGNKYGK